ncbi:MAG: hypothetical protein MJY89_00845 [Bacteroidales bacterium]|nr:hypothetical protein [Bacteroidales bacterium]
MSPVHKTIAIAYSALATAGACLTSGWGGVAFLADLCLTFFLLRRRSLISFSLSLIPSVMVWMLFLGYSPLWGYVSGALTIALVLIYKGRLPDTRQTTDLWLGTLVLTAVTCVTPFLVLGH